MYHNAIAKEDEAEAEAEAEAEEKDDKEEEEEEGGAVTTNSIHTTPIKKGKKRKVVKGKAPKGEAQAKTKVSCEG